MEEKENKEIPVYKWEKTLVKTSSNHPYVIGKVLCVTSGEEMDLFCSISVMLSDSCMCLVLNTVYRKRSPLFANL